MKLFFVEAFAMFTKEKNRFRLKLGLKKCYNLVFNNEAA